MPRLASLRAIVLPVTTSLAISFLAATSLFAQIQDNEKRARNLVQQMTLDEKIQQLHGIRDDAHYRYVPAIPRLHIPAFQITNGPAGAGPGGAGKQKPATALPSPISLAATWDVALAEQYGAIVGSESKALGNALVEAPTINIARVPQNGRTFEGYGEDPFLVGQISASNIRGIQKQGIIANVKHYAANNQETDRFSIDEEIGDRALREIYLPAFETSIRDGHSASVMCAYPKVNGSFSCENPVLLDEILRQEWKFNGFVTSDFGAVHSTVPSAMAGLDLEMPTGKYFDSELKSAIESGRVPISVIDEKLVRRFRTMMDFGVFDQSPVPTAIPERENGAVARSLAEAGIVLLKNKNGLLPLQAAKLKSIALIGPYAEKAMTGGGGSSHVVPLYTVDPADGIRSLVGQYVQVSLADGKDVAQAVTLARNADVAIVMVGDDDREGRDHELTLGTDQDRLVQEVAAANPKTVVVLKTGSAVLMPWESQVSAILEAWYPGEEDGNAVTAILFGDVNPSGRLPLSFPKKIDDLSANTREQYPGVNGVAHYSDGIFVGYRNYDSKGIEPLYPFGYGLSYSTFQYSGLKISRKSSLATPDAKNTVTVEFVLANSGKRAGAEVAQLYLGLPTSAEVPQPPKQLKGFQKISLLPGKHTRVRLDVDGRALSYWNEKAHAWTILPGTYKVFVGSSSRDIRLQGSFTVSAPSTPAQSSAAAPRVISDWSTAMVNSTLARNADPAQFGGWGYAKALYLMGQYMVWKRTGNPRYLDYIKKWIDTHVDTSGNVDRKINALDYILPGNLLLLLYEQTKDQRYKIAADHIHEAFKNYPRTEDGGLWHADSRQHQLWLDGMYMSMPFLVRYARMFGGSDEANDEAVKQLLIYGSHLRDPKTGLLFHAYDESGQQPWADPNTHHSAEFWCRAMGWYGMAIIDVLEILPTDHPRRAELISILSGLIDALARYQDPKTGLWYQIVDKRSEAGNWLETSSSCMFTYVISMAIRRQYVGPEFQKIADRGYEGVLSRLSVGPDGLVNISGICEGTNVADANYYFNRKQNVNDFHGLGAFLIMNEQHITQRSSMELIP